MSSDNEKICVKVVEDNDVTIPVEEYSLLVDHDTRLEIIREQAKKSIDNNDYKLCSDEFLMAVLDLLDYKPKKKEEPEPEEKDE